MDHDGSRDKNKPAPSQQAASTKPAQNGAPTQQEPKRPAANAIPPCPKCGKQVPVMKSKFGPDYYCNAKNQREPGCGYKFGKEDLAVHEDARAEYAQHQREAGEDG